MDCSGCNEKCKAHDCRRARHDGKPACGKHCFATDRHPEPASFSVDSLTRAQYEAVTVLLRSGVAPAGPMATVAKNAAEVDSWPAWKKVGAGLGGVAPGEATRCKTCGGHELVAGPFGDGEFCPTCQPATPAAQRRPAAAVARDAFVRLLGVEPDDGQTDREWLATMTEVIESDRRGEP